MNSTSTGPRQAVATPAPRRGPVVPVLVIVAVVVAVALVAALLLRPGAAPPVDYRPLAGTGSAPTQDVVAAVALDVPAIATWGPDPVGSIVTKDPALNDTCTLPVPGNDAQAVTALAAQQRQVAGTGRPPCLDFARSGVDTSAAPELADAGLTFLPFAVDAVTFAQRTDSPNPRALTVDQLRQIYECAAVDLYYPVLPGSGSGLRAAFLGALGLTDAADFTAAHPCVTELPAGEFENPGPVLADPRHIAPASVAQYLAQASGTIPDGRGTSVLGQVDGVPPVVAADPSAVGMVYRQDTLNSRSLSVEELRLIYTCAAPPVAQQNYAPLLPGSGSAVRAAFLSAIGLADKPDLTTTHACVRDTDTAGAPLPENTGTTLTDTRHIAPYAVEQFLAQTAGIVADVHGNTAFAGLGPDPAMVLNPQFPLVHDVYIVVPTARLAEEPTASVFVGPRSRLCAATATINRHGFGAAPNCGDTSARTPR